LLSSVNSLSVEEWDGTYGKIWQEVVNSGTLSIMIGHILQPAYSKKLNPNLSDEEILPATLSKEILQGLLRGKLGFNGMIVTDATPMVGYNVAMPRHKAIPTSINAGVDMILFNKDIREDYQSVRDAINDGTLGMERVDEAVTRILAMKAAMNLHTAKSEGRLEPDESALKAIACDEHIKWVRECADEGITLVKDTQNLLPISPEKYKKVRLYLLEDKVGGGFKDGEGALGTVKEKLEKEGFEVTLFDYNKLDFQEMFEGGVADVKGKFDLAIYVACIDTASNQSVRRIDWVHLMAADAPWFVQDIPTLFVSVANPYHLVDVPMVKTFINAYTPSETVIETVVEKIMGRSEFKGVNPVDPFCGIWGAKF
jgi:beta-N-acetylhexosaminidase